VPFLAKALRTEQTMFDRYAWASKGWFQKLAKKGKLNFTWRISAEAVRRQAAWSLLAFGFESKPALPQLHAELLRPYVRDPSDRQRIVFCLSELGPPQESIPYLVKAFPLTTKEDYVWRQTLIHMLGRGDTNGARMAMPIVIASLSDPHWEVSSVAAWALARWAQPAPEAIPPLLSLLNSTNENAASWAAVALGRITNRCDEALPGLERLTLSTNDFTQASAAITAWRLGGDAEQTRRVLEGLLISRARGNAAEFLGQMGSIAKPSVPALLAAAQPVVDARVPTYGRAQCAKAVLRIQGESPEACQILEEAITKEENQQVRGIVAGEVGELGAVARPLIPALRKALNDRHREVRHQAALALERLEVGHP
jgi:HEAT repeat protein